MHLQALSTVKCSQKLDKVCKVDTLLHRPFIDQPTAEPAGKAAPLYFFSKAILTAGSTLETK